ncbi:hypothetical protein OUZ56_011480 [Daphnia magna]|uniref:Uncharacterized protein n=1 Tax=Daphnia magna TaxID=35525 RepID=A0ABQ9Z0G8_9CRUS|nr:hypothetical protein OUZ56_011480 [Daphnia magna]
MLDDASIHHKHSQSEDIYGGLSTRHLGQMKKRCLEKTQCLVVWRVNAPMPFPVLPRKPYAPHFLSCNYGASSVLSKTIIWTPTSINKTLAISTVMSGSSMKVSGVREK